MKPLLLVALALVPVGLAVAQEREPPKDSERLAIPGCAKGVRFIVGEDPAHERTGPAIAPGRRFRLSGNKAVLKEIKLHEGSMIEVTGLVRKGQLSGPGGIAIAGGRIRVGGAMPRQGLGTISGDTGYNEVVIDVEGWRQLAGPCSGK